MLQISTVTVRNTTAINLLDLLFSYFPNSHWVFVQKVLAEAGRFQCDLRVSSAADYGYAE